MNSVRIMRGKMFYFILKIVGCMPKNPIVVCFLKARQFRQSYVSIGDYTINFPCCSNAFIRFVKIIFMII